MNSKRDDASKAFEKALAASEASNYVLRLYVAGTTQKSLQALANIREICDSHLKGRFELEVIDTYQKPDLARQDQIVAIPTLVKELPAPLRKIIGDLSSKEKVLVGLDLVARKP